MNGNNYLTILQKGVEKTLPSGLVVRLRPVDTGLILSQKFPENLMKIVNDAFIGIKEGKDEEELKQEQEENMKKIPVQEQTLWISDARKYGEIVARVALVHPRVVDNPTKEDEISADWLSTDDLMAIGGIVGVPLAELESFPLGQTQNVESVQSGEDDLPDAEPSAEADDVVAEDAGGDVDDSGADGDVPVRPSRRHVRSMA